MSDRHIPDGGSDPSPHLTHRIGNRTPSEAIVRAVAAATDTAILDLDPLYDVIDPDNLDGAFASGGDGSHLELTFTFNGCAVRVTQDRVDVTLIDDNG